MIPLIAIIVVVGVAIALRLVAGSIDTGRIESYVRQQGWTLLDKSWDPFGPGWLGGKDSRIYQIAYRDTHGDVHQAHVKTSMLGGVYLTNDQIIQFAPKIMDESSATEEHLQKENERLRRIIEELEREKRP